MGINISRVLRKALEDEVGRRRLERLKYRLEEISDILDKIDIDRIVKILGRIGRTSINFIRAICWLKDR